MDRCETYFLLFTDSFFSNIAIYGHNNELILEVMRALKYNPYALFCVALSAFSAALIINLGFGIILRRIYFSTVDDLSRSNYPRLQQVFNHYAAIICCFNMLPIIGNLIMVLAGFTKTRLITVLTSAIISRACYYYYLIFIAC